MVAIPRRRFLPSALGIMRSRTGTGTKLRAFNCVRNRSQNTSTPSSDSIAYAVLPSTPAERAPLLLLTRSHATNTNAGSQTRLYRSSNLRWGSPLAHWCSLVWISRTRRSAATSPDGGSSAFTGHLRAFQFPPLPDLLAPLALRPALPASVTGRYARDYYGASAPLLAIS